MALLPIFKTDNRELMLMQNKWSSELNPLIKLPILSGNMIESKVLAVGANVINHKLGRKPQGWFITDINAAANIYRSAAFDKNTLTLTSDAIATINLWVF